MDGRWPLAAQPLHGAARGQESQRREAGIGRSRSHRFRSVTKSSNHSTRTCHDGPATNGLWLHSLARLRAWISLSKLSRPIARSNETKTQHPKTPRHRSVLCLRGSDIASHRSEADLTAEIQLNFLERRLEPLSAKATI
jgi:hypothetical protein